MIRHKKYTAGLFQRFGILPKKLLADVKGRKVIWIHAVSVGEVQAAIPLIHKLLNNFPNYKFLVTTTTNTGQKIAKEKLKSVSIHVFYFPLDFFWVVSRVLDSIKPAIVITLETEIWPGFLDACFKRNIMVGVINGRLSDKSFNGYKTIKFFLEPILKKINFIAVQTESDKNRFIQLGAQDERIHVIGNLKFDQTLNETPFSHSQTVEFSSLRNRPLLIAGSTHRGEEEILLRSYKELLKIHPTLLFLLAPRHPERLTEVRNIVSNFGFQPIFRSQLPAELPRENGTVIILDTMGELAQIYQLATVVFIGKSLIKKGGGQNPLEPAMHGKPIVTGPYISNFKSIFNELKTNYALIEVNNDKELNAAINNLLTNEDERDKLGLNARKVTERNRGASDKSANLIRDYLQI